MLTSIPQLCLHRPGSELPPLQIRIESQGSPECVLSLVLFVSSGYTVPASTAEWESVSP